MYISFGNTFDHTLPAYSMASDSLTKLSLKAVLDLSFQIFSNLILLLLYSYTPHWLRGCKKHSYLVS